MIWDRVNSQSLGISAPTRRGHQVAIGCGAVRCVRLDVERYGGRTLALKFKTIYVSSLELGCIESYLVTTADVSKSELID